MLFHFAFQVIHGSKDVFLKALLDHSYIELGQFRNCDCQLAGMHTDIARAMQLLQNMVLIIGDVAKAINT